MKKLIYGIGYNSKGKHKAFSDGKKAKSYATWQNMLYRAYCPKYHAIKPTYIGCSVADDWLDYQDFAEWFYNHEYSDHGYELDKDLLLPGNKLYAPDRCVFVPQELNKLLNDRASARGDLPQGVNWHKRVGKYQVRVGVDGKRQHLGYFDTELEAHQTYKTAKEANVKNMALEWRDRIDDGVFDALMNWSLDS